MPGPLRQKQQTENKPRYLRWGGSLGGIPHEAWGSEGPYHRGPRWHIRTQVSGPRLGCPRLQLPWIETQTGGATCHGACDPQSD